MYTYYIRNDSDHVAIVKKSFVDERKPLMKFCFCRRMLKVPSSLHKHLDTIKLSISLRISPGLQFCCSKASIFMPGSGTEEIWELSLILWPHMESDHRPLHRSRTKDYMKNVIHRITTIELENGLGWKKP